MRRLVVFTAVIFLIIASIIAFSRNVREGASERFHSMGTDLTITVKDRGAKDHVAAAYHSVERISKLLDYFNPQSEIGRINQSAGSRWVAAAPDTIAVLSQAQLISQLSGGAFDVTRKNYQAIKIDLASKKVFLSQAGLNIDLGGIGKGYAAEKARQTLIQRGVKNALIDMHSSIAAIGGPWRIGIKDPLHQGQVLDVVELKNGEALSTSGNYEQGKHIVDPKTGKLAETALSVTVIAKDAGLADALSTAIFVMGTEKGKKLASSIDGIRCIIVGLDGKIIKAGK